MCQIVLRQYLDKSIVMPSKILFFIIFIMRNFTLSSLKKKTNDDSTQKRFVYIEHGPKRENKQCADILLI